MLLKRRNTGDAIKKGSDENSSKPLKQPEEDSNLYKGNQNPLCYHYTIGLKYITPTRHRIRRGFEPLQREPKSLALP